MQAHNKQPNDYKSIRKISDLA